MAFALTSSSRASSLIRTWFTSDMLIKILPLPACPGPLLALLPRSCLPWILPLPHFRSSLWIPARPQELGLRGPPLRLLPTPRRSLLLQCQPLPQRLPLSQCLPQEYRYSLPLRLSPLLRHHLRRSDSPPDKSCPPSFRRCPESPSIARASSPRAFPHS